MQYETDETVHAAHWYLAYTEPRRERFAKEHLDRQCYETYLPLCGRVEAMFPRYLFFRPTHAAQSIAPARSTRGIQAVVRFGIRYAQVSPAVIAAIREQESLGKQQSPAYGRPRPGQRVRVQSSAPALAGLEGLVHSSAAQRVVVLMEILGRQTPVRLAAASLEVI